MIVPGFKFSATAAAIKKSGVLDLALMVADTPAAAAGVFTTSRVKAAPVLIDQARLRAGKAQAILVNAGNANACNGPRGQTAGQPAGPPLSISGLWCCRRPPGSSAPPSRGTALSRLCPSWWPDCTLTGWARRPGPS
jgi:hypothetical protein